MVYIYGLRYDLLLAGIIVCFLIFLFALVPGKFHKATYIISNALIVFIALLTWALSEYYLETHIPLDHSLLIYSFSDIVYIITSSASFSFVQLFKFLTVFGLSIILPWLFVFKLKLSFKIQMALFLPFFIVLVFFNNITPDIRQYEQNRIFYQKINKTSYLAKQLILNYKTGIYYLDYDIAYTTESYQENFPHFKYTDYTFPFLRKNNDKDVIGSFFEFKTEKPVVVFVIVESLSRNFSGPDARWGSFTPFLDSLAKHSLYWENFIATSERTFNVLPSALGSLPYGNKGFMALIEDGRYPEFISINTLLRNSGYKLNFFYGGWAYFDYKEVFLKEAGIDFILDDKGFGNEYEKTDTLDDGFTWGYPDHAVFERSLEILDSIDCNKPRFDIYMTLSMHDPFIVPQQNYWKQKVRQQLSTFDERKESENFYNRRIKQFSTILYTDNALRNFFKAYRQRPEYNNTIFFIFGDHHLPMHDFNPLEKYHVPLLIYSPLLKDAKKFPAVSSIADLTPTLASMLSKNFNFKSPQEVHWLGMPLDTNTTFQNNRFIPLMRVNRNIDELLWEEYFLSEGRLFRIDHQLNIKPSSGHKATKKMEEALKHFIILNDYACRLNKIYKPVTKEIP